MKKLMLMATVLVVGGSVSFAQDSMGNDYDSINSYDYRYGSQMSSDYNDNYSTSYRSGSCCGSNGDYRSSDRRNNGHRNYYNY